jgi:predicted permease
VGVGRPEPVSKRMVTDWRYEIWRSLKHPELTGYSRQRSARLSSSCSYAAVALARSIFHKGADFIAAMAFQFASTYPDFELDIILAVLIGWQLVAAEFVGGMLRYRDVGLRNPVAGAIQELRRRVNPVDMIHRWAIQRQIQTRPETGLNKRGQQFR